MANENYDPSLGAQHISANLASYEAARSNFFVLIVDGINDIVKASYSGDPDDAPEEERIPKAQEILKLNVTAASIPHFSLQSVQYKRGNEVVQFAGTPSWDNGSITVDDIVGLDTKSILMAWQALAYNVHTGLGGLMKDYKKTCTLAEYTQAGELIRTWDIYGCWISDISDDDLNKESGGDKRSLKATIIFDRAIMRLPDKQTD